MVRCDPESEFEVMGVLESKQNRMWVNCEDSANQLMAIKMR